MLPRNQATCVVLVAGHSQIILLNSPTAHRNGLGVHAAGVIFALGLVLREVGSTRSDSIDLVIGSAKERLPVEIGRLVATQNQTCVFASVVAMDLAFEATANDGRSVEAYDGVLPVLDWFNQPWHSLIVQG